MSTPSFYRCAFFAENDLQCEEWVLHGSVHPENKYCAIHSGIPSLVYKKTEYLERMNEIRKYCHELTLDELEQHIREQEKVLEAQREKVLAMRGIRGDKLDKLSEEEREVRRKIKIEKTEKPAKEKKVNVKDDPVKYLMKSLNCTEAKAREFLGLPA